MSSPPNNSPSSLQVHDSHNQLTDDDFILDEEEYLEYEDDKPRPYQDDGLREIYREESRIEAEVIFRVLNGKVHTLKPNSGETIMIRESSIAVGFHVDEEEDIVWEWHGHIPRYTEEHQFSLEYIYGNYFQRTVAEEPPPTSPRVDAAGDKGLKDLFDGADNSSPGSKNSFIGVSSSKDRNQRS